MRWPKMYQSLLLLAMFAVACLIGCGQVNSPEEGGAQTTGRLQVVATTAMVADIVRQVAGDRADVTSLMKEGVDPHLYQPRRGDVVQLEAADMIFYNGLRLEGKMTDVLARLATSGRPVIAVAESIAELLEEVIENQTHVDPHVWMDVMRWSVAVDVAAEALAEHDPDHAESYRSNALQYKAAVKALDEYVRNAVATIPQQQRLLVTAHDAFG
ncbi:MAG: metal ABC transporter substrate-binding protein, partial [Phycisphaerales bacterium]